MVRIEEKDGAVRFAVYAQPRASRTELAGARGAAIRIRLAAPPVAGEANAELVAFLASRLSVSKSSIRIVKGGRSRSKLIEIDGVSTRQVEALL